jgi:hypothetical protein
VTRQPLSLDVNSYLNLFDAIVIAGVAFPTLYISTRIGTRTVKVLFVLLSGFLVVHGLYHLMYFLGDYTDSGAIALGNDLIEPASYALLFSFSVYFAKKGG